jgi:hypothetical protein
MMRTLLSLLLSAAALAAADGVIFKQSSEDLSNNKKTTSTSYVEAERVAVESIQDGNNMTFVYLSEGNRIRMIDHSQKTVREISGDELEKMMAQANETMVKMQEQFKNMSPQQRAMMEKMMGDHMKQAMGAEAAPPVYKRGEGSAEIGGRSCDWYEGYRDEKLVSKVCAADWTSLDLQASDFAVFQKMAELLTKLAPSMADMARVGGENWQEREMFPGVPVEQAFYRDGKPYMRSTMESLERGPIDAQVFEPPADYRVQKGMPGH